MWILTHICDRHLPIRSFSVSLSHSFLFVFSSGGIDVTRPVVWRKNMKEEGRIDNSILDRFCICPVHDTCDDLTSIWQQWLVARLRCEDMDDSRCGFVIRAYVRVGVVY